MEKTKNVIIIIEFVFVLIVMLVANVIKIDDAVSITERRKLAQFPHFTKNNVFSGKFASNFDKYAVDQFVRRDSFKEIKYWFSMNIFKQKDSNKMFVKNGSIYKLEYPLNENAVKKSAEKLQIMQEKYLKNANVYYSIIPDKTYYLDDSYLKMDYKKIEEIIAEKLQDAKYIDIKNILTKDDFYNTDLHWKQENILKVADILKENMVLPNKVEYEEKIAGEFYGTYYGQVGTKVEADTIKYLTNGNMENAITYNYETNQYGKVYDLEKFETSSDKYDIYLSGATPLITVENQNANTDKELLLFRDSFGSSIAPLLLENYKKVTLIDLRYMSSQLLDSYIEFSNQDVLMLYSGTVLNQNILK